jgi:hypothetical protein
MPTTASLRSTRASQPDHEVAHPFTDPAESAPWLNLVAEKVKTIRYGVVQIVVHDSKVVQIERTERTRFEVPPALQGR